MAKKKKKSSSSGRSLLYLGLIIAVALAAIAFGIDTEATGINDTLEEAGLLEVFEATGLITESDESGTGAVGVEVPPTSGEWYNVYFTSPINTNEESAHTGATVEQALIEQINNSQRTIDAALFELNSPDVTAALVSALGRGVQVRIVFDDDHALDDPDSTAEELIDAGAEYVSDERSALMHNKFFIFDSTYVWTGSMNITRNGVYNNNNNAMLFRSQKLVENYQTEFDEMFNDGQFTTRGDEFPTPNRSFTVDGTLLETYFSTEDGDEIEARLVELVSESTSSVRVMVFSFTLDSVGNAMIDRLDDGVTIEGVFETTGSLQGQMRPLACAGANIRQDGNPRILHHKVFIFDEAIVAMGSFNFSANARDSNNENMLVIHNEEIAQAYTQEWQARFAEGRIPSAEDLDC